MLKTKEGRWQKATGRMPKPSETDWEKSGFVMIDEASRGHREYKPRNSSHRSRVDKRSVRAHR